jgi:hypothetical protein
MNSFTRYQAEAINRLSAPHRTGQDEPIKSGSEAEIEEKG